MTYELKRKFAINVEGLDSETKNRIQQKLFSLGVRWACNHDTVSKYVDGDGHDHIWYFVRESGSLTFSERAGKSLPYPTFGLRELFELEEPKEPELPEEFKGMTVGSKLMCKQKVSYCTTGAFYEVVEVDVDDHRSSVVILDDDGDRKTLAKCFFEDGDFILVGDRPNRKFALDVHRSSSVKSEIIKHLEYLGYRVLGPGGSGPRSLETYGDGDVNFFSTYEASDHFREVLTLRDFFRLEPADCYV